MSGFVSARGRPLLMAVTQEGAVVGGVGLSGQPQEQRLREAQRQGELTPQLPHAVQQQQEDRRLLLKTGVGVGRVGAALLEWMSCLQQKENVFMQISRNVFLEKSLHFRPQFCTKLKRNHKITSSL